MDIVVLDFEACSFYWRFKELVPKNTTNFRRYISSTYWGAVCISYLCVTFIRNRTIKLQTGGTKRENRNKSTEIHTVYLTEMLDG